MKHGNDVTFGFTVFAALINGILIAIPVKLTTRGCCSDMLRGDQDRHWTVMEIYRISGMEDNIMPYAVTPVQSVDRI